MTATSLWHVQPRKIMYHDRNINNLGSIILVLMKAESRVVVASARNIWCGRGVFVQVCSLRRLTLFTSLLGIRHDAPNSATGIHNPTTILCTTSHATPFQYEYTHLRGRQSDLLLIPWLVLPTDNKPGWVSDKDATTTLYALCGLWRICMYTNAQMYQHVHMWCIVFLVSFVMSPSTENKYMAETYEIAHS